MTILGTGILLPTNLWVCFQLQKPNPDYEKISRVMRKFFLRGRVSGRDAGRDHRHHGAFCDGDLSAAIASTVAR